MELREVGGVEALRLRGAARCQVGADAADADADPAGRAQRRPPCEPSAPPRRGGTAGANGLASKMGGWTDRRRLGSARPCAGSAVWRHGGWIRVVASLVRFHVLLFARSAASEGWAGATEFSTCRRDCIARKVANRRFSRSHSSLSCASERDRCPF